MDVENFDMSALCLLGTLALGAGTYMTTCYFGIEMPADVTTMFMAGVTAFAGLAGRYAPKQE